MARAEFTKQTKRATLKRAEGRCEAQGALYGLPLGQRCNASLAYGVEFDHVVLEANSHDNSLENCGAVCPKCHRYKTDHHDTPTAAKTLRQQDKNVGIRKRKGRPFPGSRDSNFKVKMTATGRKVERRWG
ncbi:MAG: hypothetical protein A3E01_10050 [Gammaproteobacteria bacterium RIFCSPHIGHO2_12_FULL_63_22]|nr:MAG: hypothetical protein A3E01_10050 [Gammaproteobacteria bacterium RIFCSPHIGHO2_12_FULL_63_22]